MEDKLIMTNILDTNKSVCNLLNQSAIESDDTEICNAYKKALQSLLTMQHELYKTMQEEGWYPVEDVKQPAINKVKTKFANDNSNN